MKTNLEWLLELPQDKIKEAIEATLKNYGENAQIYLFQESECLSDTLDNSFKWDEQTPNTDVKYWINLHTKLLEEGK